MNAPARRRAQQPPERSEFVGRAPELGRIRDLLLATTPLITLVGPGGIGKTRLANEAAKQYQAATRTCVSWARLARLGRDAEAGTLAEEIVQSLGTPDTAGQSAWDALLETFARTHHSGSHPVLVLDNCEHVIPAVVTVITNLLAEAPGLTVLATSREPLGWADEQILTVGPLLDRQAVELFRRRAELGGNPLPHDARNQQLVENICAHTDFNPLFIRLAAARLHDASAATILAELSGDTGDQRLQWSHGAAAGLEERHRGVRDVVGWSYSLCEPAERQLLERMSVFAGGHDTEGDRVRSGGADAAAITAVCADPDADTATALPASEIHTLLERLVERSLVCTHITSTTVRYYLLESVRVFARDRLADTPERLRQAQCRHRQYYRAEIVAGQASWYGPQQKQRLQWARSAWDNILIAIETGLDDPNEARSGLEIAAALMSMRIPFLEGANRAITRLAEQALEATRELDPPPTALQVTATALIGWIALWQGRYTYTAQILDECVAACLPDPDLRCSWRDTAGTDIGLPAPVEFTWGLELLLIHIDPAAVDVLARARQKFAAAGDSAGVQRSELFETFARNEFDTPEHALANARALLERARAVDAEWATAWAELAWVMTLTRHGDPHEALRVGRAALARHLSAKDMWTASWVIGFRIVALTAILSDHLAHDEQGPELVNTATEIAHLVGGIETQRRAMGIATDRVRLIAEETARAVTVATHVLGEKAFADAERKGARLRPDHNELEKYALGMITVDDLPEATVTTTSRRTSRWSLLSPAEREVAMLVAAGWPNTAIASRRGSSHRTVDAQVANIRQKLLVSLRSEVIAHVPDEFTDRIRAEAHSRSARPKTP